MTSFHLLPPYRQPLCVQQVARRIVRATYLQKATKTTVPAEDAKPPLGINWTEISGNVIATVLGGALLALSGGILYIAWQVPRQQDQILSNQVEMKQAMKDLTDRMTRLEFNDRRQDERLIRQEHRP